MLAELSTSSIGALNQRSTAVSTTWDPTARTSTAGTSVRPSSSATSLARKRANGSARRRSTTSLTTLRTRKNPSASSIMKLVALSA